jgi:alpha-glucosidase
VDRCKQNLFRFKEGYNPINTLGVVIMPGKILKIARTTNKVEIDFENTKGIIEIISPWVINVFMPIKYQDHFSRAVEDLKPIECSFEVVENNGEVVVTTEKLKIVVHENFKVDFYDTHGRLLCQDYRVKREPFSRRGGDYEFDWDKDSFKDELTKKIEIVKSILGDEYFYGLGEKTGHLNKRGYFYEMWNTDNPSPHVEALKGFINPSHFLLHY